MARSADSIPEQVLEDVFGYLRPLEAGSKDACTLARAARTCRTWKEPALRRLWKHLDNAMPLFRLLGSLSHDRISLGSYSYIYGYNFAETFITERAWGRFEYYAAFLAELDFNGEAPLFFDAAWSAIGRSRPHKPLFPHLDSLHLRDGEPDGLYRFLVILSPTIRKLTANITGSSSPMFLQYLPSRATLLEELTWTDSTLSADELAPHLEGLRNLVMLDLNDIEMKAGLMQVVSALPALKHLRIAPTRASTEISRLLPGTFRNLKSLALRATISAWATFLEGRNMPDTLTHIRVLNLSGDAAGEPAEYGRFFSAVASAIPEIESLEYEGWEGGSGTQRLGFRDFIPILGCGALRDLHLKHPTGITVSTEDVIGMIDSWPVLRSLRIYGSPPGSESTPTEKGISIAVLDEFANKCRLIEQIALPMTTSELDVIPDNLPRLERLRFIDVSETSIEYPETTAMYFAHRCSRNMRLHWDGVELEDVKENETYRSTKTNIPRWKDVSKISKALFCQRDFLEQARRIEYRGSEEKELKVPQA